MVHRLHDSHTARICWCARKARDDGPRARTIRHVARSRAGNGHLLGLRSPWTWSSREPCNPSASRLSPPMKGKQKLLSPIPPSLPKRRENSPLRKIFRILRYENLQNSEQSTVCSLLDLEPHSLGVWVVVARALELESPTEESRSASGRLAERGMSATIDRLATPSECQNVFALTTCCL